MRNEMVRLQMHKKYLSRKEAAKYLDLPEYVLKTLSRIGRMNPDKGTLFGGQYSVGKLDIYRREANVDVWRYDERLLKMLKHQKTAF